jgi:transcriptional activator HAC1
MDTSIDPATLSMSGYDYPTPPPMPQEVQTTSASQPTESGKKKRKAWGQPVPEIKQILPPRKRAKTAEEKEQRKNERILRNRRAADKSRQRQKAAVADLEVKTNRIEQENAMLRQVLASYQQRFGVPDDLQVPMSTSTQPTDLMSAPSPYDLDEDEVQTPATSLDYDTPAPESHPTLVHTNSSTPVNHNSPALTSTLNLADDHTQAEAAIQSGYDSLPSTSVLTQYPAAVLCDLQCQTEGGRCQPCLHPSQAFRLGLSQLLQMIQYLAIFQTYSTLTLWPMYQIFQILGQKLATSSVEQTFPSILNSFPLIHSLISMPSTPTRPAVFRMKLLSRLLACSPVMARLLLTATDRALQQVVSEDGFAEDPERRWTWSSLMTIKWGILRLERDHRKIRLGVDVMDHETLQRKVMAGVDFGAVARSSRLWTESRANCMNMDEGWATQTATEVH